ncbi:MAG: BtaA family protein, partial [Bdellovibrionales bacterium]|nr:BtaA family protein [Bdellovibrionales bacterium]
IYNQCWEDPRLDQEALKIGPKDRVMVLTSAGCNSLNYLLHQPERVDAVDMNHRQNSLLELKVAGFKSLNYEDFFAIFGEGQHVHIEKIYKRQLRRHLSPIAQEYWDKRIEVFTPGSWRKTFYYHGTSGLVAQFMNHYISFRKMRDPVERAFEAKTLDAQKGIYYNELKPKFWNDFMRWISRRGLTMSSLGVPRSQFLQIENYYNGGMAQFIEDCLEAVFANLPLADNYFYRLYLFGSYSKTCCPEYLKEENFDKMKSLIDRVHIHNSSVLDFLKKGGFSVTCFSLLDHMDWLYQKYAEVLRLQWEALLKKSTEQTRIIWRSASLNVDFIDPLNVRLGGERFKVGDVLNYNNKSI